MWSFFFVSYCCFLQHVFQRYCSSFPVLPRNADMCVCNTSATVRLSFYWVWIYFIQTPWCCKKSVRIIFCIRRWLYDVCVIMTWQIIYVSITTYHHPETIINTYETQFSLLCVCKYHTSGHVVFSLLLRVIWVSLVPETPSSSSSFG